MLTNVNGITYQYKAESLDEQKLEKDENGFYHIVLGRFLDSEKQDSSIPEFMKLVDSRKGRLVGQLNYPIDNSDKVDLFAVTHTISSVEVKLPLLCANVKGVRHNDLFGALVDFGLQKGYCFGLRGRGREDGAIEIIVAFDLIYKPHKRVRMSRERARQITHETLDRYMNHPLDEPIKYEEL